MAALTNGRDTRMRIGDIRSGLVAAPLPTKCSACFS